MTHTAFIGLGSNLGNRKRKLSEAVRLISAKSQMIALSSIYETEPWGYENQPSFLNQVIEVETDLDPEPLLKFLKQIEKELGREETFRYGPRTIDLDILLFDSLVLKSEILSIPHSNLAERAFVLVPLEEIASEKIHPIRKETISGLLKRLDTRSVKKYSGIWDWGERTYIMGIINLTPDSFSGDGLTKEKDYVKRAIDLAEKFISEGADFLDLGAESSRPGSAPVSARQELERLLPVINAIKERNLKAIISIDTWKSDVAEKSLDQGADWINDIHGLKADQRLGEVIAEKNAWVVLMHNRSRSDEVKDLGMLGKSYNTAIYGDFIPDILRDLKDNIELARKAGIPDDRVILDPGIGFGKSIAQNLELINRLNEIKTLDFPVLVGPSRKSFIGQVLNLPVDEREEGTASAVAVSIARGADIIRVHNVRMMARVARMADAIIRRNP